MRSRGMALAIAAVALAPGAAGSAAASAGGEPQPRIVGGEQTASQEFPWQVALACNPGSPGCVGDGFDRQFCGASLVAPTIVVTAAHCVAEDNGNFQAPASDFEVFTGRTVLSSSQGQAIDVAEIYYFVDDGGTPAAEAQSSPGSGVELYDPNTSEWDVAFLELEAASTSEPILIAGAGEGSTWVPGRAAYISGWGRTAETGGTFPDALRAARVAIVSDATCDSGDVYGPDFFPQTMLCAGFIAGGVDTCSGDSGGPLVVPIAGGGFRLVGDTSWGFGCAEPDAPGVYGRIAADPMRAALEDGIFDVAGVDVTGSGAQPDTSRPQTTIDRGPKKRKRGHKARFAFSSSEPGPPVGPEFECKLDARHFESCHSPTKVKVKRGEHTFRVRATDASGNVDDSPAVHRWKVKRKRR